MNPDLQWQRRYAARDTPWDKGAPAPPLVEFLHREKIVGRILVPGCGRGHDARALAASPGATVVGLDISSTAVAQAREFTAGMDHAFNLSFLEGDFFKLRFSPEESFDWLVEHTCFCAIEPGQRPDYVRAASEALRPGGRIFGIFYLNPDTDSGPPFPVSKSELSALFDPYFDLLEEWVPRESFPGRENRELVRLLQKR